MRLKLYGWPLFIGGEQATTQEQMLQALREMRDTLLRECDWILVPDSPFSQEVKDQWILWRQYMRDLPSLVDLPLEYTILIDDAPTVGRPHSWDNWDIDKGADPYFERDQSDHSH
jgi:hypothetical protein